MNKPIHLSDTDLILFSDGETPASSVAGIEKHLASCDDCRLRLRSFKTATSAFAQYREYTQPSVASWPSLQTHTSRQPSYLPAFKWATALVACLLLGFAAVQLVRPKPPGMAVLLRKAALVETPPNRQLLVTVGSQHWLRSAVLTSQGDRTSHENVEALFRQARYDWHDPLNARSFSGWRDALPEKQDLVTEIRDSHGARQFFHLRTQTQANVLHSASLTLRADTLRPVGGAFDFQGNTLVNLSEEKDAIPERSAVPHNIAPRQTPSTETTETTAGPEDELRVFAALDSIGADAGEPITVNLDAGRRHVVVNGLGITPQRQREVIQALSKVPSAIVQFNEFQGLVPQHAERTPKTFSAVNPSPLLQILQERAGGPGQLQAITDQSLESSSSALVQAYALWTLAQTFPAPVEATFSDADRETLRSLRQRHTTALAHTTQQLNAFLEPLLKPRAKGERLPTRGSSWQSAAKDLLDSTRAFDRLLNQVLAGADGQVSDGDLLSELSNNLDDLSELTAR